MSKYNWVSLFIVSTILILWLVPLIHPILHYDEISAVTRAINFANFNLQWEMGIKPDGHPPLLQLLIWTCTQLFGIQPFVLRFMGVFFGLWAVLEGYKLSIQLVEQKDHPISLKECISIALRINYPNQNTKKHIDSESSPYPLFYPGLITALLLGMWWWSLSVGYQIRPYSIALPFVFKSWAIAFSNLSNGRKHRVIAAGKLCLLTLVCAWTHHFAFLSALTATLVFYARQFFIVYKTQPAEPSFSLLSTLFGLHLATGLLGYLPIIELLKSQWSEGGLSWLGKPLPSFLPDFFADNFHPILVLFLIVTGVLVIVKRPKYSGWLLFGFLFQYGIIHGYSLYRMPVLQPSALYFSLPLLFILTDLGWKELCNFFTQNQTVHFKNSLLHSLPLLLFAGLLIDTTVLQKWHTKRQQNYHYEFAQTIKNSSGNSIWIDAEPETVLFHLPKSTGNSNTLNNNLKWINNLNDPKAVLDHLKNLHQKDSLILCSQAGSQPWLLPLLSSFFRNYTSRINLIGGQISEFSGFDSLLQKQNPFRCDATSKASSQNASKQHITETCDYHCPISLSNDTLVYNTLDTVVFSFNVSLLELHPEPNDVIVVIAPIEWKSHHRGLIVESTLHNEQEQIDWRGTLYEDFQHPWCNYAFHTVKLSDIPGWNYQTRLGIKTSGAWAWIGIFKGNPYQYGLTPYNYR